MNSLKDLSLVRFMLPGVVKSLEGYDSGVYEDGYAKPLFDLKATMTLLNCLSVKFKEPPDCFTFNFDKSNNSFTYRVGNGYLKEVMSSHFALNGYDVVLYHFAEPLMFVRRDEKTIPPNIINLSVKQASLLKHGPLKEAKHDATYYRGAAAMNAVLASHHQDEMDR